MSAEWTTVVVLLVSAFLGILEWRLRALSAAIVDKLDARYLRKPEDSLDHPVSRRELELRLRSGIRS